MISPYFPLLSSLAAVSTAMVLALPVGAANYDYDRLQLIKARPLPSANSLNFFGDPGEDQGYSAFFNFDPAASDGGHTEIGRNAPPGSRAPYYATGRPGSPALGNTATRSATLETVKGFTNFFQYLQGHNISLNDLGFNFGVRAGRDFRETWNLQGDQWGENWSASSTSNFEERIYSATPDAVESYFTVGNTKILQLGYTPVYTIFDYGQTVDNYDDTDILFSNPVSLSKVPGLPTELNGLADALLKDVKQNGGALQFLSVDEGAPTASITFNYPYVIANVRFPVYFQIVSVPEPSTPALLWVSGASWAFFLLRNKGG